MPSDFHKQAIITGSLRTFRAKVAEVHTLSEKLTWEELSQTFSRLAREFAWIAGNSSSTNTQILDYLKTCQRLASVTRQIPPIPKVSYKLKRSLRVSILERDNYTCRYCERKGTKKWDPDRYRWHIDHMLPRSRGGNNHPDNLALACAKCNMAKHMMTADEFTHGV